MTPPSWEPRTIRSGSPSAAISSSMAMFTPGFLRSVRGRERLGALDGQDGLAHRERSLPGLGAQQLDAQLVVAVALARAGSPGRSRAPGSRVVTSASMGTRGCPPQRRSTGSAGARTTTTSQVSVALRSLVPAFNCIPTAVLPRSRVSVSCVPNRPLEGDSGYLWATHLDSAAQAEVLSTAAPGAPAHSVRLSRGKLAPGGSHVDRRRTDGQRPGVAARPRGRGPGALLERVRLDRPGAPCRQGAHPSSA